MNKPKAYGSFVKKGGYIYRLSAYLHWGESMKSIGACLLLNPGSAKLDKNLTDSLNTTGSANGLIQTADPTMKQLIKVIEEIYGMDSPINGRFHIYNLFNLQNASSEKAIDQFETLVNSGFYDIKESLVELNVLQSHPWILLGWSVKRKPSWKNLESIKELWRNSISLSKVPTFGKKHLKSDDYYHPCPLIPTQQPTILAELILLYKQKFNQQRFPIHATMPIIVAESSSGETIIVKRNPDRYTILNRGDTFLGANWSESWLLTSALTKGDFYLLDEPEPYDPNSKTTLEILPE